MIDVAVDAAKKGGALAYRYFKSQLKVTYKADNSIVTKADVEVEKLIRKIIAKHFPDHGIIGEEFGETNPKAKFVWTIDPVDGTKDFVRKIPTWATLLALLEDQKPVVGIAFFAASGELFSAEKHSGTHLNGKSIKVSKVSKVEEALVLHSSINRLRNIGKLSQVTDLCAISQGKRNHGAYNWALLLKGSGDVVVETGQIHDFAAPKILVEEAGGKFSDFSGKDSLTSGTALATNGLLHDQVLKILNS